jgi:flagellar protein FlaG
VNTETVPILSISATNPASGPSSAPKRTTVASPHESTLTSKVSVQAQVPDTRSIQEAAAAVAEQIESYLRSTGRQVQFSIDHDSGRTVVSIRDANTGDVIRQIPTEEALRLAQALGSQPNSLIDVLV